MKLSEGPTALTWSFSLVCLFHKLYGGEILMLNNKIIEHYNPAEISIIEIRILLIYLFISILQRKSLQNPIESI